MNNNISSRSRGGGRCLVMFERCEGGERLSVAVSEHGWGPTGMVEGVLERLPTGVPVQAGEPLLVGDDPVRPHWSAGQSQWVRAHLAARVLEVPGSHVQLVHVRKLMVGAAPVVSVGLGVVGVGVRMRVMRVVRVRLSPGQDVTRPLVH